jgi:hypothetical protein
VPKNSMARNFVQLLCTMELQWTIVHGSFYETLCFMELQCFSKDLWSGIICFRSIMKMVNLINGGAILLGTWARLWSSIKKGGQRNLTMKEGCLFVLFVLMRFTELGCFKSHSWSLWKALEEGCISLVSLHLDLQCKSA